MSDGELQRRRNLSAVTAIGSNVVAWAIILFGYNSVATLAFPLVALGATWVWHSSDKRLKIQSENSPQASLPEFAEGESR
jgi:hypothetical protein